MAGSSLYIFVLAAQHANHFINDLINYELQYNDRALTVYDR